MERTWRDKGTKTVSCVSNNNNRNIRYNIHSRNGKTRSSNVISKSVPIKGKISAVTEIFEWQVGEKDRICFNTKDHGKMWIKQNYSIAVQRTTKATRRGSIPFISEYNRSIESATLFKELESTIGTHRKSNTYSNGMDPI